jgi:type II secretory ATPase GspE/PulE/Tfp pilus assembly ATPase PilB-like protein
MEMSEALRELVINNAPAPEIRRVAMSEGMSTLRQSGLRKVIEGLTTLEEVVRETM